MTTPFPPGRAYIPQIPGWGPGPTSIQGNPAQIFKGGAAQPATPAVPNNYSFTNPNEQNAFDLMASQLRDWGLGDLLGDLRNLIVAGDTSGDTLTLALSQTTAYKQRFKGNQERIAGGLSALSPAQYIAMEDQYQQILRAYGMPAGFYDSHDALAGFIGKDVSAAELDSRAKIAHDQFQAAPAYVKQLWSTYYGMSQGDAIAAILDPDVATQVIQDRATQVGIGGAAAKQGLGVDQQRAQQLQQAGVTGAQADKTYTQIAQSMPVDQQIANRFGTTFDQAQEENDLFLGQAPAAIKRQTLYGEEEGLFRAKSGADSNSLGVSQAH